MDQWNEPPTHFAMYIWGKKKRVDILRHHIMESFT